MPPWCYSVFSEALLNNNINIITIEKAKKLQAALQKNTTKKMTILYKS